MKKSLTLLLAIAMVFSMFATVAFADTTASMTTADKFNSLENSGIFNGFPDGTMGLNQDMTRGQFAKVVALTLGLNVTTGATPSYTDTTGNWASDYIEAVTKAGLMNGMGFGKFAPEGQVTIEQMAKVLDSALHIDTSNTNAAVSGNVSDWAKSYVAAAVQAGLISASTDYTVGATRGQLVDADYTAYQQVKANGVKVTSSSVVDANTISVTFSDGVTKQFTLNSSLQQGVATQETVTYNNVPYTVSVTLTQLAVSSAKQTGPKEIAVTFNQAVSNTADAKITVKNNGATVYTTASWSTDKTTLTLTSGANLADGTYTVQVGGIGLANDTTNLTVAAAKVSKIVIPSNGYISSLTAKNPTISLGFKLYDQFGNDVTSTTPSGDLKVVSTLNTTTTPTVNTQTGTITFGGLTSSNIATVNSMTVTLIDTQSSAAVSNSVKVTTSKFDSVKLEQPTLPSGQSNVNLADTTDYAIPYTASDVDGNQVSINSGDLSQLTFISSDTSVFNPTTAGNVYVDSNGQLHFKLASGLNGSENLTVTVVTNLGQSSTITFAVYGNATPNTPALVAPTSNIASNDGDTNIYLNVKDVFGNAMSPSDIASSTNVAKYQAYTSNSSIFTVPYQNAANNTPAVSYDTTGAYIKITPQGTSGTAYLTFTVQGGSSTSIPITINDAKYAASITLSPSVSGAVYDNTTPADSGISTLKATVKDQYGDDITSSLPGNVGTQTVKLYSDNNGTFAASGSGLTTNNGSSLSADSTNASTIDLNDLVNNGVNLKANKDGASALITAELVYNGNTINETSTTLNSVAHDATLTYAAGTSNITLAAYGAYSSLTPQATVDESGNDTTTSSAVPGIAQSGKINPYAVQLTLVGKDSSGNTVALPSNTIQSMDTGNNPDFTVGQDATNKNWYAVGYATGKNDAGNTNGTTGNVNIYYVGADGTPGVISAPVTVKTDAPAAQSISASSASADITVDPTNGYNFLDQSNGEHFTISDQYGTSALSDNSQVAIYIKDNTGNKGTFMATNGAVTTAQMPTGDYTVTCMYNGLTSTINVHVN